VSDPRVIVALDYPDLGAAEALVGRLDPHRARVKVGKELFTRAGPRAVTALTARGFEVFLDLKYHDIPNTVAAACRAAAELGVWMVNVHASGGRRMLEAARDALAASARPPRLVAVTVLTSLDRADLAEIGFAESAEALVLRLARLAAVCGLDGVVCSPQEIAPLRAGLPPGFTLVTPGIRPAGAAAGDQKRVLGPRDALALGANYLVIGRPITAAPDPAAALAAIETEITEAGV
jgi:orotidine-5'-phosphate decarboxylase